MYKLRICTNITVDAFLCEMNNRLNWEAGTTLHPDDMCRLTTKKGIEDLFRITSEGLMEAQVTILRAGEKAEATMGEGIGSGSGVHTHDDEESEPEETVATSDGQQKTDEELEVAVHTISSSAWPEAGSININTEQDVLNQYGRTTRTGQQVAKNTTQDPYGTEQVQVDQPDTEEFKRDARDMAGSSGSATGVGSGSSADFKPGPKSNTTRPDITERHQAATAAAAESALKAVARDEARTPSAPINMGIPVRGEFRTPKVSKERRKHIELRLFLYNIRGKLWSYSVASLIQGWRQRFYQYVRGVMSDREEHRLSQLEECMKINTADTLRLRWHYLVGSYRWQFRYEMRGEMSDEELAKYAKEYVTRQTINAMLSVMCRWRDAALFNRWSVIAEDNADREEHRLSQLEECMKRNAVNMLRLHNLHVHVKHRLWEWCDQKEATLGAYREKYLVKYVVAYINFNSANIMRSALYQWRGRTIAHLKGDGTIKERVISCNSPMAENITPEALREEQWKTFLYNTGLKISEYLMPSMTAHKLHIWNRHLGDDNRRLMMGGRLEESEEEGPYTHSFYITSNS